MVSGPGLHFRFEVVDDRLEELLGGHPALVGTDEQREVLGHLAAFDGLDANPLERLGELHYIGRVVEAPAIDQAARPGEDAGDRIGAGRLAFLVLAIVAGDRAMRGGTCRLIRKTPVPKDEGSSNTQLR